MTEADRVYVGHMLDTARKAHAKLAAIRREDFDTDENLRLAVTHLLQIIGEAAGGSRPPAAPRAPVSPGPP